MQCPRCKTTELVEKPVKGKSTRLDQCPTCKGIWFDDGEVAQIINTAAVNSLEIPSFAIRQKEVACPRCHESLYMFTYPGTMTLVDVCRQCKGIWLDDRELNEIYTSRHPREKPRITCPKCAREQPGGTECIACGIVFAKYNPGTGARGMLASAQRKAAGQSSYADGIPGVKGGLLRFVDQSLSKLWYMIRNQ